jgi:hypothetical protein
MSDQSVESTSGFIPAVGMELTATKVDPSYATTSFAS